MLNSFEISRNINEDYTYNFSISEDLFISYNHEDIFNSTESDNKKIISYGYCFDVRNPQSEVIATLNDLLSDSDNLLENIKYLNGHYVLIFNVDGEWKLITDAASITPVYCNAVDQVVSTKEADEWPTLSGVSLLDLRDFTTSRIELSTNKLSDERIERMILDLVTNQYKYFMAKDLTLNFRRNKMNKAIISILYPALLNQTLNLRETDVITIKIGKWLSRDYKMNILSEEVEPSTRYLCNTHLMDYNYYMRGNTELNEEQLDSFNNLYNLNTDLLTERSGIEYNILNHLRYRNEKKQHLIYDPFNVLAIQEIVYGYSDNKTFDPLTRIIKIIHPAIDFYDFAEGVTLLQKYTKLKKKTKNLTEEMKKFKVNEKFLRATEEIGIEVSDNLDGVVIEDGITFYPATQHISKEDLFEVEYKKKGQGMVLIESYFNNPKNAHRIKVNLNDEIFNIDEFLNGKFVNVGSEIFIKMSYEREYEAASWQKAGKITIKEIN